MRIAFSALYIMIFAIFVATRPAPVQEKPKEVWEKPKVETGGISPLAFADSYASEKQIGDDVLKLLRKHNQTWSQQDFIHVVKALQFGNNHPDYRIDYRIVLAYFAHESHMNKYAWGRNSDGSTDSGLGQHNSCCLRGRWTAAYFTVKNNKITDLPTSDPYDVTAQTIATIQFLRENRTALDIYGKRNGIRFGVRDWVLRYNPGLQGPATDKYYAAVMDGVKFLDDGGYYSLLIGKFSEVM